ncbi:AAA family ATPase [Sutcliffiella halmapala]|uniref:AAA family ATPase n=1 Tax=Sutcliffiella halmapala TaxID=79882 RepID=UPI00099589A4|nr:SMC family ATPase [Sutcliffiella halmapala]
MKPITLTVAGLQSFREKQIIDFEALCQGGVFGIFGPTGSGKSSILDAMTLALYGKVERASNNTQGIMNHAENVLDVSFLFELENAKGKQRYKVERSFKRTDDIRVKSGICRLSEVKHEEHIVIADKASEVNAAIQEIIGLTIDDFTRAVVLPQGKFAEFLSLKGADRRQMLQRLFQLEKYGDELSRKIKDELQTKTRILGEIHAEQLGLGEASDIAVKEAKKAFKEIANSVENSEMGLQQLEVVFEEKKKKWEWQAEKQKVEDSLLSYQEQEPAIKDLETKLSLADRATAIKPILDDLTEIESALKRWSTKFGEDKKMYHTAKEALHQAMEAYEVARKKKEKEQPALLSKKEKLERARKLEEGMKVLQTNLEQLDQNLVKKQEQLAEVELHEKKTKELYQKAVTKQKSLKVELASNSLAPNRFEKLQLAFDKKQEIIQVEKKLTETNEEVQTLSGKMNQFRAENVKAEAELTKVKEGMLACFSNTEKHYAKSSELTLQLDWLSQQVEQQLLDEKRLDESMKIHQLALDLATSLEEGRACPVCGSTDHPNRATHDGMREIASSKEDNGLERLVSLLQQEKQENVKIKLKLEQVATELYRDLEGERSLPSPSPTGEKIEQWEKQYDATSEGAALLIEKYHDIEAEQRALLQDMIHTQEKKVRLDQALRKWTSAWNESQKLKQTYEEQWSTWSSRMQGIKADLDEQQLIWGATFAEESFEEIEQQFHHAKEVEKQMKELQERINKSVDFIEEKEKELKRVQETRIEAEKILFQDNLERKQMSARMEETKAEISSIAGNEPVSRLLQQVEQDVANINELEAESYKAWNSAQTNYHEYDKRVKQSEQMLEETTSRQKNLAEKWSRALEEAAFSSKAEVEKAILFLEYKISWQKKVQQYWEERNAIEKDWERLNSLIGEEKIKEAEWLELQESLKAKRQKLREEIEAKSAAFQHLSSIEKRNERYRVLEDNKEKLTVETQAFQKLQSVFKGNSFVEYLAEEQLLQISRDASERLGHLTRQRYALEMDSQGGFVIRDDANGGVRRPVSSLSGGETFLTSLALALSLSAQIQLRGEYPLQFFFLDEGFGTLDHELLDAVVTALEKLQSNHLAVGVISHVQELRARLPRRLVVTPADATGKGSTVKLEEL